MFSACSESGSGGEVLASRGWAADVLRRFLPQQNGNECYASLCCGSCSTGLHITGLQVHRASRHRSECRSLLQLMPWRLLVQTYMAGSSHVYK